MVKRRMIIGEHVKGCKVRHMSVLYKVFYISEVAAVCDAVVKLCDITDIVLPVIYTCVKHVPGMDEHACKYN